MSWDTDLYHLMSNDANISGAVGSRIYPVHTDNDTLPLIIYQGAGNDPVRTKDRPSSLEYRRVQVAIEAEGIDQARQVAGYVRTALDHQSYGGIEDIDYITDNEEYNDDLRAPRVVMEFELTNRF